MRSDSGNRMHIITARRMISGLVLKYRRGSAGSSHEACRQGQPAQAGCFDSAVHHFASGAERIVQKPSETGCAGSLRDTVLAP